VRSGGRDNHTIWTIVADRKSNVIESVTIDLEIFRIAPYYTIVRCLPGADALPGRFLPVNWPRRRARLFFGSIYGDAGGLGLRADPEPVFNARHILP
jgi:hypothetical protein